MERAQCLRTFLIIGITFILFLNVSAQSFKKEIYNAYINGDMTRWEKVLVQIEQQPLSAIEQQLELISYYYGYIGFLLGTKEEKTARTYINKGEKLIDHVLKEYPDNATANACKGSFLGFRMSLNKFRSVILGPESMKYIKKAYQLDSSNVQAIADKANMLYYAPVAFGGKKTEALRLYQKAIGVLEKKNDDKTNWFYLHLLTTLAQQYESMKQYENALTIYEKILKAEPAFEWVKNELYPQCKILVGKF